MVHLNSEKKNGFTRLKLIFFIHKYIKFKIVKGILEEKKFVVKTFLNNINGLFSTITSDLLMY